MKDQDEITGMLANLQPVDAPENFEGRVRSRIAERKAAPPKFRLSLLLVAKFAFPMLLLLAVGGFLIVSNERELSGDTVPPVGTDKHNAGAVDVTASTLPGTPQLSNMNSRTAQVAVNRGGESSRPIPQGGSEDIGLSPDDSTLFPDGVDPRKATVTNARPPAGGSISPVDVLLMIGISSSCLSTGCSANSIREGSIAARAGVQTGDMISAIDGRAINSSTGISGKFSVSELTLVRLGKRMTVSIARR